MVARIDSKIEAISDQDIGDAITANHDPDIYDANTDRVWNDFGAMLGAHALVQLQRFALARMPLAVRTNGPDLGSGHNARRELLFETIRDH